MPRTRAKNKRMEDLREQLRDEVIQLLRGELESQVRADLRKELRDVVFQEEEASVREEARAEIHERIRKEEYAKLVDEMAIVRERLTKNIVQEVTDVRKKEREARAKDDAPKPTAQQQTVKRDAQQTQPTVRPAKLRRFYGRKLQTF